MIVSGVGAKWIVEGRKKRRHEQEYKCVEVPPGGSTRESKFRGLGSRASKRRSGGNSDVMGSRRYTGKSKAPPLRSGAGYRVKDDDRVKDDAEKN
jgi:hypothetical protein